MSPTYSRSASFTNSYAPISTSSSLYGASAASTAAAALDAADGVIDGKYFGTPIVAASTTAYGPSTPYPITSPSSISLVDSGSSLLVQSATKPALGFATGRSPAAGFSPLSSPRPQPSYIEPYPVTSVTSSSVALPTTQEVATVGEVPPVGACAISVVGTGYGFPSPVYETTPVASVTSSHTTIREVEGAAAAAAEFRDLRAMLEKDREQLALEWERFRETQKRFEELEGRKIAEMERARSANIITVKTMQVNPPFFVQATVHH